MRLLAALGTRARLAARQLPILGGSWPAWISAIVFGLLLARAGYAIGTTPERYPDFIVGSIAWGAARKSADYWLLGCFVIGSLASMLGMAAVRASLLGSFGHAIADRFERMLGIACLPAAMWAGGLLLTQDLSFGLLHLSGAACLLTIVLFAGLAGRRRAFRPLDATVAQDVVGGTLVLVLAAGLAVLGLALAADRASLILHWSLLSVTPRRLDLGYLAALGAALLLALHAFGRAGGPPALQRRLRTLLLVAQVPLAWLYLVLRPAPTIPAGIGAPTDTPALDLVVLLLAAATLADLFRRRRSATGTTVLSALSPLSLIAVLLLLKTNLGPALWLAFADDYHFGEFLVPWWSLAQHHLIPYWDFSPARGLLANYLPGLLSATFFGGTASDLLYVWPLQTLAMLLVAFFPLARVVGRETAFLLLLLAPAARGLSEIDVVNTAVLVLLCRGYMEWRPTTWLAGYGLSSLFMILIAPGQGGLVALALSPLALMASWRGWRDERRQMAWTAGAGALVLLVLGLATPLGPMTHGAIRYGIEQSSVNTVANGIAWSLSLAGENDVVGDRWLWEAGRASWILAASISGVLVMAALAAKPAAQRTATIVFGVPIFLLAVFVIFRAAGRIDPKGPSRLGVATIWFWALLVPLLLFIALDGRRRIGAMVLCAGLASLMPLSGRIDLATLVHEPAGAAVPPADGVTGTTIGLPGLGTVRADPARLHRLVGLRQLLDGHLRPGETYLDMTNHGADYFYLDRPPPIEVGAFYNLIAAGQQVRAVRAIAAARVPLVLIDSQNILFDGGPASLRAPLLYRFVALNYVPVRAGEATWLVRPDRLSTMAPARQPAGPIDEAEMNLLDRAFGVTDLGSIPANWGRSARSLAAKMEPIAALGVGAAGGDVRSLGAGRYGVTGSAPFVAYAMARGPLAGRDAGLLAFDFKCNEDVAPAAMAVSWSTRAQPASQATTVRFRGSTGRLIVPLDAAPRWLLADDITEIRIGFADGASCTGFEIDDVALFQRSSVGEAAGH